VFNFNLKDINYICIMQLLYPLSMITGAVANLLMAVFLAIRNKNYRAYTIYLRARRFTVLWLAAFAAGYLAHAIFGFRFS